MRKNKKRNFGEEGYWKSFTDMMAGLLLIILLIMMLLMLYLTQANTDKNDHTADHDSYYDFANPEMTTYDIRTDNNKAQYTQPPKQSKSGGGGGEDDPGEETPKDVSPEEGHDKTAVLVTVVDEETGNVIKKEGTLFELYADKKGAGGLQTLHTYYPKKVEYKQYKTTTNGTFYLPEKITRGWYSLHNLTPPPGYGTAEDFDFQITESLDWPEPYRVKVPFSPSKNRIYVSNIDAETNKQIGGQTYTVYASEDIVTLDGTVRYKEGAKVDEFKCDENGNGKSKKLYLGKYYLVQKTAAKYYARYTSQIDVEIKLSDSEKQSVEVKCEKTQIHLNLTDEYTKAAIKGAVYTVTDKPNATTNNSGNIFITDLDKNKTYTLTLTSVPEPYRISTDKVTFSVDRDGNIQGKAQVTSAQTAYVIRLSVDAKDIIFKNSISGTTLQLYDEHEKLVEEWEAVGEANTIEGLEPGSYFFEVGEDKNTRIRVHVKDTAKLQKAETQVWTLWDTIMTVAFVLLTTIIVFVSIRLVRFRKRKKANG